MMTMIATILGGVPLVSGKRRRRRGARGARLGAWSAASGFATLVTLYLTPVAYLVIARFAKPHADEEPRLHREMEQAEALQLAEAAE